MLTNLFSRITKWFQKIFGRSHIKTNKLHQDNSPNNKIEFIELPKESNNISEQPVIEIPRAITYVDTQPIESFPEEISTQEKELTHEQPQINSATEPPIKEAILDNVVSPIDEIKIDSYEKEKVFVTREDDEEIDSKKERKPYSKKSLSKENNINVVTTDKEKKTRPQQVINLGNVPRWRRRREQFTDSTTFIDANEGFQQEELKAQQRNKSFIKSSFVEINLDEATIYLVLPRQTLGKDEIDNLLKTVTYKIKLNDKENEVIAKIKQWRNGNFFIEKIEIPIEEPLQEFEIIYPSELEDRKYTYRHHNDKIMYVFSANGNNKAKMDYLFNENGEKNLLLKKKLWIILHEDYELLTKPEIIIESYPWNSYQLFHLDLRNIEVLKISNRTHKTEDDFPTIPTFNFEGKQVEDDFKYECPLFIGNNLKLFAPNENSDGWNVWIQNSSGDYKIFKSWNGNEALSLNLPGDLPTEYGEFQVDICQQGTKVPDDVLFFRYIPLIELDYPHSLIIPDAKVGHKPEIINIVFEQNSVWKLNCENNELLDKINKFNYELNLPIENDSIKFYISKYDEDENRVTCKITVPRLKWKTSRNKSLIDKPINVNREDLIYGEQFNIFIQTNDFNNGYSIIGKIEENRESLQAGIFVRNGFEHIIGLNQFFDTIKSNFNQLTFKIEIYESETKSFVKSLDIFRFKSEQTKRKKIMARVKYSRKFGNKTKRGKGFSKKEMKDAGLTKADILKYCVPFDKRRKSAYNNNTNLLKRLSNS